MSECHSVTVSQCHSVTVSQCHNVTIVYPSVPCSLVGTTSIGFNLFLGGAMAEGKKLRSAQRGIAFSTTSAFIVSVLILIVGAGYHNENNHIAINTTTTASNTLTSNKEDSKMFSITDLAGFLNQYVGQFGVIVYSVGFIAAALSSMLTVPLGAAITADSVFSDRQVVAGSDNKNYEEDDSKRNNQPPCSPSVLGLETENLIPQKLPHKYFLAIMFVMVIISTVVISANGQYLTVFYVIFVIFT